MANVPANAVPAPIRNSSMSIDRLSTGVAAGAAALSPVLMLTLQGGTGYCFFVVLAFSLLWLSQAENRHRSRTLLLRYKWYVVAMTAYPLAIGLQALLTGEVPSRAFDSPSRLLLSVPIFLLLAAVPAERLRPFQWGCVIGALGACFWSVLILFSPAEWVMSGRAGNPFTNPIPFGDTALVLGFMGAIPLAERGRPRWELVLRLLGLAAGCYASYASESRGGWIAIPVMLWVLLCRFDLARMRPRRLMLVFAASLTLGAMAALNTPVVQSRIAAATSDFERLAHGDADTSIGLRLQLWQAAWTLFEREPALGVGKGTLKDSLQGLAERGEASPAIIHPHAHNELFSTLAEMGLLGLAVLLLLYYGSTVYFWRHRHSPDPDIATAAAMGLVLTLGTVVFGLTIDVFTLVMNTAFFGLTSATLLGIIANRTQQLEAAAAAAARSR